MHVISDIFFHFPISGRIVFDAFHKQVMRLISIRFLFETDSDLIVDKKYLCLLIVFACMEYYLTAVVNIIIKKLSLPLS